MSEEASNEVELVYMTASLGVSLDDLVNEVLGARTQPAREAMRIKAEEDTRRIVGELVGVGRIVERRLKVSGESVYYQAESAGRHRTS
jgi:hypothetical protein